MMRIYENDINAMRMMMAIKFKLSNGDGVGVIPTITKRCNMGGGHLNRYVSCNIDSTM